MKRTAILKHTLPDGSWHYDWLVQCSKDPKQRVPTFRTGHTRPDAQSAAEFKAERIGDHRAAYLDYEGPISRGRGEVVQVASGEVVLMDWDEDESCFVLDFGGRSLVFAGVCATKNQWVFKVE